MSTPAENLSTNAVTRLGRYALRYKIAEGGMAAVYLAQTVGAHGFESWVAIKLIHEHLAQDPRFVSMFLDEARVTGMIRHPNVCSVLDFGEHEGQAYLVMEYLHGESARAVLRRATEALPSWLAARLVCDAARGLEAAHVLRDGSGEPMGIVHRDVSPQNIVVLYDGHTKVVDFGVARAKGRLTDTRTGETKGKLAYMAPEQVRGREVDQRTDVWALGVVLWELLTRHRLFRGENDADSIYRVLQQEIQRPSHLQSDIPKALDEVTRQALMRDPDRRLRSAGELADMLEAHLYSMGKPAGASQVAHWMRDHFADKRATREAMLRAKALPLADVVEVDMQSNSSVGVSRSEHERHVEVAGADAKDPSSASESERRAPVRGLSWSSRGVQIGAGLGAALLLMGAVALGTFAFGDKGSGADSSADSDGAAVTRAATAPRHTAPAIAPAPPIAVPERAQPAPAAPQPAPAAPQPAPAAPQPALTERAAHATTPALTPPHVAANRAMEANSMTRDRLPPRTAARRNDRTRSVSAPERGRLNLVCIPRARVFLRGRLIGTTPLAGVSLRVGRQRLLLRSEDGSQERTITVQIRAHETTQHPLVRLSNRAHPGLP